jgi:hypothetical protein
MTIRTHYFAIAATIGALAVPAAAQTADPYQQYQQVPQPYAGQPGYGYAQQGYPGYNQSNAQDPVSQIINSLLGNRYNVTDRQAVSQCASAALNQAHVQYGNRYDQGYGNNGYANNGYANNGYGSNGEHGGYNNALRVTSITDVQRRHNGLRVSGLMSSSYHGPYGNHYGDQNRAYGQTQPAGDITFRCNVDYRGQVSSVRLGRNNAYHG